jgi:MFS family permease
MMISVAVGWHIYSLTHRAIDLGFVGLAQFLPMMLLILPAGDVADRFDRRLVLSLSFLVLAFAAGLLFALTLSGTHAVWPIYGALIFFGVARAFAGPASQSLLPRIVPPESFTTATSISASAFQFAIMVGPALGGALYVFGPAMVFGTACVLLIAITISTRFLTLSGANAAPSSERSGFARAMAGLRFVWKTPVVLGAISLDLFAVLLGGATALLPVYASDILHTGPFGLGLLRGAPALGAMLTGLVLAGRPIERKAGPLMFGCVALFGLATIVFGVSTSMPLSLAALFVLGASDMVSVVLRFAFVQLATPDAMRGRVSAVNVLFISASNELGEFESGSTAALFGTVPSVVIGGLGTIAIVALWALLFPQLRKLNRPVDVAPVEAETPA